jgi:methanogenic corrinoid protein MtbC1
MKALHISVRFGIGEVERDTGISKDTLRIWERRYGFPNPVRDANGERLYDGEDLERLRLIKRLLDAGKRPGKLVSRSLSELSRVAAEHAPRAAAAPRESDDDILAVLKARDGVGLHQRLSQLLLQRGLQQFVMSVLAPLNTAVGDAWARGDITTFDEHLYTESVHAVLRVVLAGMRPAGERPRVLLTTLPQEQHGLGLLMVEALLTSENARCISLGTQTPLSDIVGAADAHRADVVGLSFSESFPTRLAMACIRSLRNALTPDVEMWIGGRATARLGSLPEGVTRILTLEELLPALAVVRAGLS